MTSSETWGIAREWTWYIFIKSTFSACLLSNLHPSNSFPILLLKKVPSSWLKRIRRQVNSPETSFTPPCPQLTISLLRSKWFFVSSGQMYRGEQLHSPISWGSLPLILFSFRKISTTIHSALSLETPLRWLYEAFPRKTLFKTLYLNDRMQIFHSSRTKL